KKAKTQWLKAAINSEHGQNHEMLHELRAKLYAIAPRYNPQPENWYLVGNDALASHEFDRAARAFKKGLTTNKLSFTQRRNTLRKLRICYKALGDKEGAL